MRSMGWDDRKGLRKTTTMAVNGLAPIDHQAAIGSRPRAIAGSRASDQARRPPQPLQTKVRCREEHKLPRMYTGSFRDADAVADASPEAVLAVERPRSGMQGVNALCRQASAKEH